MTACSRMPSQTRFSIIFLNMFRHRFRCHLGPILVPTWLQLGIQNRPKIDPRAIQTPSQLASCFRSPFGWIFERIFIDFRLPNRPKINQNSIKKSTQHHNNQKTKKLIITRQGRWNRALGHVMLATKMYKNPHSNLQKTGLKSTPQLGSILWPTWPHFGRVWGVKMDPSWHQIASEMTLQIHPKNDHILNRSWDQFWSILGSNLAPKRGPKKSFFDVFLALEPILGPRWPQDPPRALQITILIDFWTNFNRFLNQFYEIVCWNSIDFWTKFVNFLPCFAWWLDQSTTHGFPSQARWRYWPAGQLDLAPPKGTAVLN